MFTVRINEGARSLEVEGGPSLLASLAAKGVWLPSICGGTTSCGECANVVHGKFENPSSVEKAILGEDRLERGMRLACSVTVASDIDIHIPDEVLAIKMRRVRVAAAREIARDTRELRLEAIDGDFTFRPGQYLRVVIPPHEGLTESFQRAYSFASPPGGPTISIIVRRSPSGLASVWLHDRLAVGDALDLVGPFGTFGLPEGSAPLVCVAGGTGLAPFFPIFMTMDASGNLSERDVVLVFGAKAREDLFGLGEFEAIARRWSRFRFMPVLQEPDDEWRGAQGLVTEALASIVGDSGGEAKTWSAALCGSPGMVKACERVLARHGIQGDALRRDSFA